MGGVPPDGKHSCFQKSDYIKFATIPGGVRTPITRILDLLLLAQIKKLKKKSIY